MKEEVFEKHANTINEGKVKYKMESENENYKTENETKEIKFTNANRKEVKMINVDDTSKYDHLGH